MECQGTENSPAQGVGHLIVYGIEGKQNDVGSDVFDALYVVEKGEMVMQTALDMNGHRVLNSNHYIYGYWKREKNNNNMFKLNGLDKILLPEKSIIKGMDFYFSNTLTHPRRLVFQFDLNTHDSYIKKFDYYGLSSYNKFAMELIPDKDFPPFLSVSLLDPIQQHAEIMLLITYIVP